MIISDDGQECRSATSFAVIRAANTGGGIEIRSMIPPDEFSLWNGVNDMMAEEERERIYVHSEVFATWMRD